MRTIKQELTLSLRQSEPGFVDVRVKFKLPSSLTEFVISYHNDLAILNTNGFRVRGERYEWTGETTTPWFTAKLVASEAREDGYNYYDHGPWAITNRPQYASYNYSYRGPSHWEFDFETEISLNSEGAASPDGRIVYLGPHSEWTQQGGDQTFRLIEPTAATLYEDPHDILAALVEAAERLNIGARTDSVVAIAGPTEDVNWGPTGRHPGAAAGFWVTDDERLSTPNNTWIHEYVHTRQTFDTTDATKWLREGMADYYAALIALKTGFVDFETFHQHVSRSTDEHAVLAAPHSWSSPFTDYVKGRRVLAALDVEIRQRSGSQTLQAVFRRLNQQDDPVRHGDFRDAVAEAAGTSLKSWLDRYVRSQAAPDVPDDPSYFDAKRMPEGPKDTTLGTEPSGSTGPESDPIGSGTETETGTEEQTCPMCNIGPINEPYCPECGTALGRECPVCGTPYDGNEYCSECGSAFIKACPVCGTPYDENSKYCQNCGTDVVEAAQPD